MSHVRHAAQCAALIDALRSLRQFAAKVKVEFGKWRNLARKMELEKGIDMARYFRLIADPKARDRWILKSPIDSQGTDIDPRIFTAGSIYKGTNALKIPVRRAGVQVDFNFADFDMPVTSSCLNEILALESTARFQCIPVEVCGVKKDYEILNLLDRVACFDATRSECTRWTESDGRTEKIGQLRMFTRLRIDPAKVEKSDFFSYR